MTNRRRNKFLTIISAAMAAVLTLTPVVPARAFASAGISTKTDAPSEWAAEDVAKAREYGLIPDNMYHSFIANISRLEFCRLVMALYTKITSEPEKQVTPPPFTDTSNISVLNAYDLGIVKGVGGGKFAPYAAITRQEIAVMLYNAISAIGEKTGKDITENTSASLTFTDLDQSAYWAVDAIKSLRANEIMLGDDKNRFNPLDNTTKEMAFILVNRIYLIYSGLDAKKAFPVAYTGEILMRIKGVFINEREYQIIGDVFERYPEVKSADLNGYLNGGEFNDGGGKIYYLDKSESLSESVAAGYTGGAGGGTNYPVYVLTASDSPQSKLYIVNDGRKYGIYLDSGRVEPFLQKTFSDVLFAVPEDTAVFPAGAAGDNTTRPAASGGGALSGPTGSAAGDTGINNESGDAAAPAETGAAQGDASGLIEQITFSELFHDAQELFDSYVWIVQLSRGKVMRLTAYILN